MSSSPGGQASQVAQDDLMSVVSCPTEVEPREKVIQRIKDEHYKPQPQYPGTASFAPMRGRQDSASSVLNGTMNMSRQQTLLWGAEPIGRSRQHSVNSLSPINNSPSNFDHNSAAEDPSPRVGAVADMPDSEKLGTFKGVFLPCLQNILGVILFLRLPWITAQAGLFQASGIVLLCALSTFITALSLSALATNGQVQAGGPYYVVSRNLGHEVGGAIGVIFYLGTTIAASMYILGAVEAFRVGFEIDEFGWQDIVLALILCLVLASIVAVGVKYVNMSAQFFLAIVLVSILCLQLGLVLSVTGAFETELVKEDRARKDSWQDVWVANRTKQEEWSAENGGANVTREAVGLAHIFKGFDNIDTAWEKDGSDNPSFLWCIGLFYPSVTGIMAGSNRSGVLRDAKKSIPVGTLSAILCTTVIYMSVVLLYGSTLSNEILKEEKLIVTLAAFPHKVVVNLGIIMSCIGAGLQCLTGAPRLLSAIALDGTMPILSVFAGEAKEPTRAVFLTWIVASLPCLLGSLNAVTPIITMFFLLMYATVNFSCFLLTVLRAPGWRPTWKYYGWYTALFGFVLCLTLMILISYVMAFVSFAFAILMLVYIHKQRVQKDWGDSIAGIRFQVARDQLLCLTESSTFHHPKNWRPQILVLAEPDASGNPLKPELLALAAMLKKGRGLLMTLGFIKGDLKTEYRKAEYCTEVMRMHIDENELEGFPRVQVYDGSKRDAIVSALQATGCGALRPNAVIMGWPDWAGSQEYTDGECDDYIQLVKSVVGCNKAAIILKNGSKLVEYKSSRAPPTETIDVWWIVHDGGLLILLPHLLRLHKAWRGCPLRIFSVINEYTDGEESVEQFKTRITHFLNEVRITAEVIPINLTPAELGATDGVTPNAVGMVPLGKIYHGILQNRNRADLVDQVATNVATAQQEGAGRQAGIMTLEQAPPMMTSGSPSERDLETVSHDEVEMEVDPGVETPEGTELDEQEEISQFALEVASAFNADMRRLSSSAGLIVTNLPLMVSTVSNRHIVDFVETLTKGLGPTLLIRGSGNEVVTSFG